jgi:hypothetical protein
MKSSLKKKLLLSNDILLNLFLFNENKYIKIFTEKTAFYFFSSNLFFNVKPHSSKKKFLFINSFSQEKNLFNFLILYIFQFQKISRKKILIKGLGYRITILKNSSGARNDQSLLQLKLGFSHFKTAIIPCDIQNYYLIKNSITFESFNASKLGNFVTRIKSFRTPDIYKGKGLHIKQQKVLILKPLKKK